MTTTRDYTGQIEAAENGTGPDTGNDWLICGDCGRPMYYDNADDNYHHAISAGDGCFLIPAENRMDDLDHPLLADADLIDAAFADYEGHA